MRENSDADLLIIASNKIQELQVEIRDQRQKYYELKNRFVNLICGNDDDGRIPMSYDSSSDIIAQLRERGERLNNREDKKEKSF